MSGILARAVAQTVVFVVNVASKAFMQAYAKAQSGTSGGRAQASSAMQSAVSANRMPLDQARQVLNLEKQFSREEVLVNFDKHYSANDPDKGGSFYVQSKVFQARETLIAELRRQAELKANSQSKEEPPMR